MSRGESRVLGLDVGEARIGVAVSDPLGLTAQPLLVLERQTQEADLQGLRSLVETYAAQLVVVGMPVSLSGAEGPAHRRMQEFVEALTDALAVPVVPWDERLTTVEAGRHMRAAGEGEREQRGVVDKVAASIILQSYLDAQGRVESLES